MSENKQFNLRAGYYHEYTGIGRDTDENLTTNKVVDLLNEQEKEIQQLKLIIDGLNYALKNIRQIDVEIDLNECGEWND